MKESLPSNIDRALIVAIEAHYGQVDKGGAPYILHPLRLCVAGENDDERIVGLLHDVLEDSNVTYAALKAQFGTVIADAVNAMTKREGEDYSAFIARCGQNAIARKVKLRDLADNMDVTRLPQPLSEKDEQRLVKYRAAQAQLLAVGK